MRKFIRDPASELHLRGIGEYPMVVEYKIAEIENGYIRRDIVYTAYAETISEFPEAPDIPHVRRIALHIAVNQEYDLIRRLVTDSFKAGHKHESADGNEYRLANSQGVKPDRL
jgi:hypothetical protein